VKSFRERQSELKSKDQQPKALDSRKRRGIQNIMKATKALKSSPYHGFYFVQFDQITVIDYG